MQPGDDDCVRRKSVASEFRSQDGEWAAGPQGRLTMEVVTKSQGGGEGGPPGPQRRRRRMPSYGAVSTPSSVEESMSVTMGDDVPKVGEVSDLAASFTAELSRLRQKLDAAMEGKAEVDVALVDSAAATRVARIEVDDLKRKLIKKEAAINFVEAERNFLRAQVNSLLSEIGPESKECLSMKKRAEEDVFKCKALVSTLSDDVSHLRESKARLEKDVQVFRARTEIEQEVKLCKDLVADSANQLATVREENEYLKEKTRKLEEECKQHIEDLAILEEQAMDFADKEKVLNETVKAIMDSPAERRSRGSQGEENMQGLGKVRAGSKREKCDCKDNYDRSEDMTHDKSWPSIVPCVEGFMGTCADMDAKVKEAIANIRALMEEIKDLPNRKPDLVYTVEGDILDIDNLSRRFQTEWASLHNLMWKNYQSKKEYALCASFQMYLDEEGEGEDEHTMEASCPIPCDEAVTQGIAVDSDKGESPDDNEVHGNQESCFDNIKDMQDPGSPASTVVDVSGDSVGHDDGTPLNMVKKKGPSKFQEEFCSEIDDTDLPCAMAPSPKWERPVTVPRLDLAVVNGTGDGRNGRNGQMMPGLQHFPQQLPPLASQMDQFMMAPPIHFPPVPIPMHGGINHCHSHSVPPMHVLGNTMGCGFANFGAKSMYPVPDPEKERLKQENQLIRSTIDSLLKDKTHALGNLEVAKYDISVLRSEVSRKDEERRYLRNQLEQMQAENSKLKEMVGGLEICKEVLVKEMEHSGATANNLNKVVSQISLENKQLKATLKTIQADLLEATTQVAKFQCALNQAESEKFHLSKKLNEASGLCEE